MLKIERKIMTIIWNAIDFYIEGDELTAYRAISNAVERSERANINIFVLVGKHCYKEDRETFLKIIKGLYEYLEENIDD